MVLPYFWNDRMRHNNWFGLTAGDHSQTMPRSLILLFNKWVNLESRRGMRLCSHSWERLLAEPKELSHLSTHYQAFPPITKLFLLLSATSQLVAGGCGLPAPAFLRPPRALNPCSTSSTHRTPQHCQASFWKPLRVGSGSYTPALPSHKDPYHLPPEGREEALEVR